MSNILLAISGASGAIYAKSLIEQIDEIQHSRNDINFYLLLTDTAKKVWEYEIGNLESFLKKIPTLNIVDNSNFNFKYASGSNKLDCMIVLPCSMGSMSRIACGISHDLLGRIADVQLKEKRKLIICPRETPYSLIHLNNMITLVQSGAIIAPANPSFYHQPITIDQLVKSFSQRILEMVDITVMDSKYKWNDTPLADK